MMNCNFKKGIFATVFSLVASFGIFAQQHITNFGIVDTSKVYEHFFRKSAAVKAYDNKRADIQKELDKRTQELRDLKDKKEELDALGDADGASKLVQQIKTKTEFLRDYKTTKDLELKNLKKSLSESNDFYIQLSKTIKRVAENEGLSMILNLQGENAILWYSPTVDVTEKVIKEMEK